MKECVFCSGTGSVDDISCGSCAGTGVENAGLEV